MITNKFIPKIISVISIYFYLYGIFKSIEYTKSINKVKPSDVSKNYDGCNVNKLNQNILVDDEFNKKELENENESVRDKHFIDFNKEIKSNFNHKNNINLNKENNKEIDTNFKGNLEKKPNTLPYKNLIYILFDGLRYDWTIPKNSDNFLSTQYLKNHFLDDHYLSNLMPNLYNFPNKFHSLSVSAIPTATAIRIAGLITGSPSNYLEGIKTFINDKINIDNLVNQLYTKYDSKISFYGDRTWIDFCPILNNCPNYTIDPYAKINLVENETKAMSLFLERIGTDRAVLGHFISLDAFGHLYGTRHEEMRNSLVRFDNFIQQVYDKMDDETLLVLTSDHGITDEGEHGGVSKPEMSSFVCFVTKRELKINNVSDQILNLRREYLNLRFENSEGWMVHQDDILPTVCYLMNLSVPNNSYGNVIFELVGDNEYLKWFYQKKIDLLNDKNLIVKDENKNCTDKMSNENYIKNKVCDEFNNENKFCNDYKTDSVTKNSFINLDKLGEDKITKNQPLDENIIKKHYNLTTQIYKKYSGNRPSYLYTCFGLLLFTIILLFNDIKLIFRYYNFLLILVIIMVSHSIRFLKNEKLVWVCLFLINNMSMYNLVVMCMFCWQDNSIIFFLCLVALYLGQFNLIFKSDNINKIREVDADIISREYKYCKVKECCNENKSNKMKELDKNLKKVRNINENEFIDEGIEKSTLSDRKNSILEISNKNKILFINEHISEKEKIQDEQILDEQFNKTLHKSKIKYSTKIENFFHMINKKYENIIIKLLKILNRKILKFNDVNYKNFLKFEAILKLFKLVYKTFFDVIKIKSKIANLNFINVIIKDLNISKLKSYEKKIQFSKKWKIETHIYIILSILKCKFPNLIDNRNFIALHPSMLTLSLLTFNPKLNILYLVVPYLYTDCIFNEIVKKMFRKINLLNFKIGKNKKLSSSQIDINKQSIDSSFKTSCKECCTYKIDKNTLNCNDKIENKEKNVNTINNTVNFIYPLLNILSGIKNIEKLDYSVPYVFTDTPSVLISSIPAIFYFVYPRTLVKKKQKDSAYYLMNLFSLIVVFVVTLWEFDSMMFHFFFAGRCFFICLFFVIDLIF